MAELHRTGTNLNPEDITVGKISPACGKAAMEWVTKAGELAMGGVVSALATAPLNKEAAGLAGYKSIGHMELLQELSKSELVATMLMAKNLPRTAEFDHPDRPVSPQRGLPKADGGKSRNPRRGPGFLGGCPLVRDSRTKRHS